MNKPPSGKPGAVHTFGPGLLPGAAAAVYYETAAVIVVLILLGRM